MKFTGYILILALVSCKYDKGKLLQPMKSSSKNEISCGIYSNLGAVSYSLQVKNIISNNCLPCHDASAGIKLYDYSNLQLFAASGQLTGVITSNPNYIAMPPNYRLDSCSIVVIKNWVAQGAKNN